MRFVIILTVTCLLYTLTPINGATIRGNLPNKTIITNFFNKFLRPYIDSLHLPDNTSHAGFRTGIETPVQIIIREKIQELKPFLNDDDSIKNDSDENIMLDGSEETTIIEFTPNTKINKGVGRNRKQTKSDAFKADIQVYKKLREKITKAIKKEPISSKTAKFVTKTFDGLIAKLIGSQCTWKSVDHGDRTFRFGKNDEEMLYQMHNITKEEWEHFKQQYAKITQNRFVNETLALFNNMQSFFTRITNKTTSISKKYKVKCQLVEIDKEKQPTMNIRHSHNILRENTDADECPNFQVCSNELDMFMTDFYNSLNDTSVSAFRNYAAMYARDVITDGSIEKDPVIGLINNISNTVERRVNKLFAKETKKIKLDPHKNKENNVKIMIHYVNSTTGHVKRHIKKHLEKYLRSLRARLLFNVKKDIDVNLSVDLGNLARDFISRICTVFVTCNGKYSSRRDSKDIHGRNSFHLRDGKSVYVKVQLTLDEELKNTLVRNRQLLMDSMTGDDNTRKHATEIPVKDKYLHISITRTTPSTTKSSKVISTINTNRIRVKNNYTPSVEVNEIFIEMKPLRNVLTIV